MRRVEVHAGELMTVADADLDADGSPLEFVEVVEEVWVEFVKLLESDVSDSGNAVGEVNSPKSIETLALAVAVKPSKIGRVSVAYAESDIIIGTSVAVDWKGACELASTICNTVSILVGSAEVVSSRFSSSESDSLPCSRHREFFESQFSSGSISVAGRMGVWNGSPSSKSESTFCSSCSASRRRLALIRLPMREWRWWPWAMLTIFPYTSTSIANHMQWDITTKYQNKVCTVLTEVELRSIAKNGVDKVNVNERKKNTF